MESKQHHRTPGGWVALALWALAAAVAGCGHQPASPGYAAGTPPPYAPQPGGPAVAASPNDALTPTPGGMTTYEVTGEPLSKGILLGKPRVFGNLTVFPILAKLQPDVGPVTSLDAALESGTAEVREISASPLPPPQPIGVQQAQVQQPAQPNSSLPSQPPQLNESYRQVRHLQGTGAQVGTLIIENKGAIPIYVLAGTVVKGGQQDRQIGQDFVVPPLSKVPVDAFCVEQGRWTATRQGKATDGRFKTLKQLATNKVRKAGQYESNQGKVWKQVAEVNLANQKSSASSSLMATLDDPTVGKKRAALTRQVTDYLGGVSPSRAVVGFAYAVDGKVEGARWFANHDLFALFRESLVNTSAVDALTAAGGGPVKAPPPVAARQISQFVKEVDRVAEKKSKATQGANVNEYQESKRAYGSSTIIKPKGKKPVKLSSDYMMK